MERATKKAELARAEVAKANMVATKAEGVRSGQEAESELSQIGRDANRALEAG